MGYLMCMYANDYQANAMRQVESTTTGEDGESDLTDREMNEIVD